MGQGWICLHRQLLEWEWYSDINTTRLFLHCLLKANHKEKKWQGKVIPRGSFITGRNVLANETGLTVRQIRTSLDRLKSTNELTINSTNKYSIVTVLNYGFYQDGELESTNKMTNKKHNGRPTNDHQTTTTNNDNNVNNDNNKENKRLKTKLDYTVLGFSDDQIEDLKRIRKANKGTKLTQRIINALAKEFHNATAKGYTFDELLTEWELRGWKSFKNEWIKQNPSVNIVMSEAAMKTLEAGNRPPPEIKGLRHD